MVKENSPAAADHPATLRLRLRVWRQRPGQPGAFEEHELPAVPTSASSSR